MLIVACGMLVHSSCHVKHTQTGKIQEQFYWVISERKSRQAKGQNPGKGSPKQETNR